MRATIGECPADPIDAPGQMWRDYRVFDKDGGYHSQHSAGSETFDEVINRLVSGYDGNVVVKEEHEDA